MKDNSLSTVVITTFSFSAIGLVLGFLFSPILREIMPYLENFLRGVLGLCLLNVVIQQIKYKHNAVSTLKRSYSWGYTCFVMIGLCGYYAMVVGTNLNLDIQSNSNGNFWSLENFWLVSVVLALVFAWAADKMDAEHNDNIKNEVASTKTYQ